MSTPVQRSVRLAGKNASFLDSTTGNSGEIFLDLTSDTLRLFSGKVAGGVKLATRTWVTDSLGNYSGDITTTGKISAAKFVGDIYASNGTSRVLDNGTNGSNATFTGSVTGTVSSISNHSLDALSDVNLTVLPTNGQVLSFNGTSWIASTISIDVGGLGGSSLALAGVTLQSQGLLKFNDLNNSNYLAFKAPTNVTTNYTYTLPAVDGTVGQVLSTDGTGTLSWITASGSGGGGTTSPGGATTNVQYNNNGTFAGSSGFTFNSSTGTVTATVFNGTATIADKLSNARTINGVNFDGTTNITVPSAASTLTGTTIASNVVTSSLTTVGTLNNLEVSGNIVADTNVVISTTPTAKTHATNKKYVDSKAVALSIALS
jgi:hypothetical protein